MLRVWKPPTNLRCEERSELLRDVSKHEAYVNSSHKRGGRQVRSARHPHHRGTRLSQPCGYDSCVARKTTRFVQIPGLARGQDKPSGERETSNLPGYGAPAFTSSYSGACPCTDVAA